MLGWHTGGMRHRPPSIDGLSASTLQFPPGAWPAVLDCLCELFPAVARLQWRERMAQGRVLDGAGRWLTSETPYRVGLEVHYYGEMSEEALIPFDEVVLHADADLLVADKPHFLPVMPAGAYVHETLMGRLIRRIGNDALVPLHRIDRDMAGLVLFSTNPQRRARYQALFRERRIEKHYEAIAGRCQASSFHAFVTAGSSPGISRQFRRLGAQTPIDPLIATQCAATRPGRAR